MKTASLQVNDKVVVERQDFQQLLDVLVKMGYRVLGPTVRDRAVVYDELRSADDLAIGWTDEQDGGTYRLKKGAKELLFGYGVGQHSWKEFLFLPKLRLWQAKRKGRGFEVTGNDEKPPRFAFIGVRSCDLHAIAIQDKVFAEGAYVDPTYHARRKQVFVVAVNCCQPKGTCFCVSMKTGPRATFGFDLALTEVLESGRHYFLVEVGTEQGAEVLREVAHQAASEEEVKQAEGIVASAAENMGRIMDTTDIKDLLYRNYEHPRWIDVAARCLTCANCTMVCPTCFCSTVEDYTDIAGERAERWRKWDSCFTLDFTYIHGGSIRVSSKSRYRQWMTHKLATWIDQFGTSGCVGCGRCITWCPVGIDITEEVRAIRETEKADARAPSEREKDHANP